MKEETLQKLQATEFEILEEIVRVCDAYGLAYYLIGGTLLGAIRHKGFIPWDDDIDIVMPRDDYERLIDLCAEENVLRPAYSLHSYRTDRHHYQLFAKVRKKNTVFIEGNNRFPHNEKGIYVDIFPLDDARKQVGIQKWQHSLVMGLTAAMCEKMKISERKSGIVVRLLAAVFTVDGIVRLRQRVMRLCNNPKYAYYVNFGSQYGVKKQTIEKTGYAPAVKVEFMGRYFNAPNGWDFFLRRIYGDNYMEILPPDKRITHNPARLSFDSTGEDEPL